MSGLASKSAIDLNRIVADVSVLLDRGSLTLGLSTPALSKSAGEFLPFLELAFNTLDVVIILLGDDASRMKSTLSLADINVYEALDPKVVANRVCNSRFGTDCNRLISRRILPTIADAYRTYRMDFEDRDSVLFKATMESSPSTSDYELAMGMVLQELEIVISPGAQWVSYIAKFFTWPEEQEYWSEMEMSALNQLADLKTRLDAKLEYMMCNHTNIMLEVKIKAPLLVLSESGDMSSEHPSDLLLVDLGYIHLCTEKLAKLELTRCRKLEEGNSIVNSLGNSQDLSCVMGDSVSGSVKGDGASSSFKEVPTSRKHSISPLTIVSDEARARGRLESVGRRATGEGEETHRVGTLDEGTLPKINTNSLFQLEEEEEEELFDVFQMQLTQLEVYMVSSADDWRELTPQQIAGISIVEKFDIAAEIHSSVLPWDSTLPPVKLYIDLPELHVRLSEDKLERLAIFFSSLADSSQRVINSQYDRLTLLGTLLEQKKTERNTGSTPTGLSATGFSGSSGTAQGSTEDELTFYDTLEASTSNVDGLITEAEDALSDYRTVNSRGGRSRGQRSSVYSRRGDSSICSDDSFQSAEEYMSNEEVTRRVQDLQYALKQRESMRTKLMSELRFNESGNGTHTLYKALEEELYACNREIQHLQVAYVEALMDLDETKAIVANESEKTSHDILMQKDHSSAYNEDLETAVLRAQDIDRLRSSLRNSIFKTRPTVISQKNIELLYARLNISCVYVTLSCSASHHRNIRGEAPKLRSPSIASRSEGGETEEEQEIVTVRCKFGNINLRAKHRSLDTKLSFSLRDLEIEDVVLSEMNGIANGPICLLTSEPTMAGIFMPLERFQQSGSGDLLRVKYEVIYPYKGNSMDRCVKTAPKQVVRVQLGFLGGRVDQNTVAILLSSASKILSEVPAVTPAKKYALALENEPHSFSLSFKATGVHISLIEHNRSFFTLALWAVSASLQTESRFTKAQLKLADLAVHHIYGNSVTDSTIVFGRKSECYSPFLVTTFVAGVEEESDSKLHLNVKVAPINIVICPSLIIRLVDLSMNSPILELFNCHGSSETFDLNLYHQSPSLITPNTFWETLVDSVGCDLGEVEVNAADIDINLPAAYSDRHSECAVTVLGIKTKLVWNNVDVNSKAMEAVVSITDVSILAAQATIIDPFVITILAELTTSDTEKSSGLSEPLIYSLFPPKSLQSPSADTVQFSIGVSPVDFHVQEQILHNVGRWMSSFSKKLDEISKLFPVVTVPLSSSLAGGMDSNNVGQDVPDFIENQENLDNQILSTSANISRYSMGGHIYLVLVLHEIVVSIEVEESSLTQAENPTLRRKSPYDIKMNELPAMAFLPLFILSLRGIELSLVAQSSHNRSDFEYQNIDPALFEMQLFTTTIDFIRTRAPPSAVKRILCTVADATSSDWQSIDVVETTKCASIVMSHSTDGFLNIDVNVGNLQMVFVSEAILALATLSVLYSSAFAEAMDTNASFTGPRWIRTQSALHLKKKMRLEEKSTISLRETTNAHPSSVPLSVAVAHSMQKNAFGDSQLQPNACKILLNKEAFQLPEFMTGITISMNVSNVGVWIPVDENNSHSQSLHLMMDIYGNSSYLTVDWSDVHNEPQTCWVTRISISGAQLNMSRIIYGCIFEPINPIQQSLNRCATRKFSQKEIVAPIHTEIVHSIIISAISGTNQMKLTHRVDALVQDIDVMLYLNYDNLLKLFDNTSKFLEGLALIPDVVNDTFSTAVTQKESMRESSKQNETTSLEIPTISMENIFILFLYLADIATFSGEVQFRTCRVYLINDFFRQPATIGRVIIHSVHINLHYNSMEQVYSIHDTELTEWEKMVPIQCERSFEVRMKVNIGIEYQNPTLIAWEPVLETVDFHVETQVPVTVSSPLLYWTFSSKCDENTSQMAESLSLQSHSVDTNNYLNVMDDHGSMTVQSGCTIKVDVREVINFNLTMGLIEVVHSTIDGISRMMGKQGEEGSSSLDPPDQMLDVSMAVIRNDCGLPLSYLVYDGHEGTQMDELAPNTEKSIAFENMDSLSSHMELNPLNARRSISISVKTSDGASVLAPIRDIRLEGCGNQIFGSIHSLNILLNIRFVLFHI